MSAAERVSFIAFEPHRQLVAALLTEAQRRPEVVGVLLIGSLGRGNAVPGSDVDLLLLVADGRSEERPVHHEERAGVLIELHYRDSAWASAQMDRDSEWIYAYLEGRILYDPTGNLARLVASAQERFAAYRTPPQDKARIVFLADRTRDKLQAALAVEDHARAGTIVALGAGGIVRLLWAAHDRPTVGPTNLWHHLAALPDFPAETQQHVRELLLGHSPERVEAAIALCTAIVTRLSGTTLPSS